MVKRTLLILILSAICGTIFAQTDKHSVFQLTFLPFLSSNGPEAKEYSNAISFNILAGSSKNEEVFAFAGLSNFISNNATGFQFAGLANTVSNNMDGFQFAGIVSRVGNDGKGAQFSGLTNIVKNNYNGFQFAGLNNHAKEMKGFQFAGLVNASNNMDGFQFGGLINRAQDMKGFQFAGLVNIARKVKGVQFAGLVNVAEESDCPIGLINIIKKGEKGIGITYDLLGSTVVSFRSGGKYTYGIIGVGYNHKTENNTLTTEGGFGAHINCLSWFRIKNELKATSIGNGSSKYILNSSYSLLPAFRVGKHFELWGGPSINHFLTNDPSNKKILPDHSLWKKLSDNKLQQIYIGYQVGLQYIF